MGGKIRGSDRSGPAKETAASRVIKIILYILQRTFGNFTTFWNQQIKNLQQLQASIVASYS